MSKLCIYCQKDKPLNQFSLEHILPEGLVGTNAPELFKTNKVCSPCNSTCGIWVDGPFLKNCFLKMSTSIHALHYYEFSSQGPLPLTYMGVFSEIEHPPDEICELWLGPCGDSIYHFHKKSDARYGTFAGGNFIDLKKDGGKAFIFLATDNPDWVIIVLKSFYVHFKNALRFSGTELPGLTSDVLIFHPLAENENEIIEKIRNFHERKISHKCHLKIDINFELRFLAKVALGLGANIFGEKYLAIPYARELKKTLWAKTIEEKANSLMLRNGYFEEKNEFINKIFRWEGAHTIVIQAIGNFLGLTILVFGEHLLTVTIADNLDISAGDYERLSTGQVYISIPIINEFKGPFSLPLYIAHKLGNLAIPELKELEKRKQDTSKLPPKRS